MTTETPSTREVTPAVTYPSCRLLVQLTAKHGWHPSTLVATGELPTDLLNHVCPGVEQIQQLVVIYDLLLNAVDALGDTDRGLAADIILGLRHGPRSPKQYLRREAAARALYISDDTFRKSREKGLIEDIAFELYRRIMAPAP